MSADSTGGHALEMKLCLVIGILSAILSGLRADPLRVETIPSDAAWVAHFNVDGFLKSQIGKTLVSEIGAPLIRKFETSAQDASGIDFEIEAIRDVALIGRAFNDDLDSAVILTHTTLGIDAFLDSVYLKLKEKYPERDFEKRTQEGLSTYIAEGEVAATRVAPGYLGIARDPDSLHTISQSFDHKSRKKSLFDELPKPSDEAIFTLIAVGLRDSSDFSEDFPALKQAKAVQVSVANHDDKVRLSVDVLTDSPRVAELVHNVFRGMLASLRLMIEPALENAEKIPEPIAELARGDWNRLVQSEFEGPLVKIKISLPSNVAIDSLEVVHARETKPTEPKP